jgi:hypothetical protein
MNKIFPIILGAVIAFYYSIICFSRAYTGVINKKDKRFKENVRVITVSFFMRIVYAIITIFWWVVMLGAILSVVKK